MPEKIFNTIDLCELLARCRGDLFCLVVVSFSRNIEWFTAHDKHFAKFVFSFFVDEPERGSDFGAARLLQKHVIRNATTASYYFVISSHGDFSCARCVISIT